MNWGPCLEDWQSSTCGCKRHTITPRQKNNENTIATNHFVTESKQVIYKCDEKLPSQDVAAISLAAVGPNTLSADEDEVFEQEINGVLRKRFQTRRATLITRNSTGNLR
jgi:hypothetical protein